MPATGRDRSRGWGRAEPQVAHQRGLEDVAQRDPGEVGVQRQEGGANERRFLPFVVAAQKHVRRLA